MDIKVVLDGFFILNGQDVFEVEDGLFLVSVFGVGVGGEVDGFVVGGEFDVEL